MATLEEVAKEFNVSLEQVRMLRSAMSRTWSQVYYDLAECFEGGETELYAAYKDEAEMVAENTLDADRVTTFCPDLDLKWVYRLEDGTWRPNCIALGEAVWRAR
jgi:hypothetical protein